MAGSPHLFSQNIPVTLEEEFSLTLARHLKNKWKEKVSLLSDRQVPEEIIQSAEKTDDQAGAIKPAPVCIGVSGGPDSMALCHFLAHHSEEMEISKIHALIVDHGLRPDSGKEAESVKKYLESLPEVQAAVLKIKADISGTRVQEQARLERYKLMTAYCREYDLQVLLTAHHMDDQAETLLFRLAKGSGLDGLGAMPPMQRLPSDDVILLRPFLDIPKAELVRYCEENNINYVSDPSNQSNNFARPRLRASKDVLEKEGLTAKRLAVTAKRLLRAREALDQIAGNAQLEALLEHTEDHFVLKYEKLASKPEEIRLRVLLMVLETIVPESPYRPRLEKLEKLEEQLFSGKIFRKQTLGNCVFSLDNREGEEDGKLIITREKRRNI